MGNLYPYVGRWCTVCSIKRYCVKQMLKNVFGKKAVNKRSKNFPKKQKGATQ